MRSATVNESAKIKCRIKFNLCVAFPYFVKLEMHFVQLYTTNFVKLEPPHYAYATDHASNRDQEKLKS